MELRAPGRSVVVVVVTHDPGDWFEETLRSLAALDYPGVQIVVVDAASPIDLSQSISTILPEAIVHRLSENCGYGSAANEVLELIAQGTVEAPDYFVFAHDDVAPAPDAVTALVEAATECGAAVVGPKLLLWDDPSRFAQMGAIVDKTGAAMPLVEAGDLDQGQHDGLREVFEVPGAFTLVRSDLFLHIGGFDEAITYLADDLSMCWRAQLAGARVVVASAARVRHVEALRQRIGTSERRRLLARHRLRVVLTSCGRRRLVRLTPQLVATSAAETGLSLLVGKFGRARAAAGAWCWNVGHAGSVMRARGDVKRFRRLDDEEIRRLQVPGLVRPRMLLQRVGTGARRGSVRDRIDTWRARTTPGSTLFCLVLAALLVFGSRHLLTRDLPTFGDFAPFGPGLLRLGLILGTVPLGVVGAARLLRPTGSARASVGAALAYAAMPVPYLALSQGRWAPLATYAAAPWLLAALARASQLPPYDRAEPGSDRRSLLHGIAVVGLQTALLGVFVPLAAGVTLLLTAGLVVGGLVAFERQGLDRLLAAGIGGAALGAVLVVPRTLEINPGGEASFGWALVVASGAALFVARSWRFSWALRGGTIGLGGWALASRGDEVLILMAGAAAGVALAVGMGIAAVETDVLGRKTWRFGLRRMIVAIGSVALFTALATQLVEPALDGDWSTPSGDFSSVLGVVDEGSAAGRVLWLGDPAALPAASWRLDDATAVALTDGLPVLREVWTGPLSPTIEQVTHAVELAVTHRSARLGQLLAPQGVAFVVVPERLAPAPVDPIVLPADPAMADALAGQLDLERVDVDSAVTVYRNLAFDPALMPPTATSGGLAGGLSAGYRLFLPVQAVLWAAVLVLVFRTPRERVMAAGVRRKPPATTAAPAASPTTTTTTKAPAAPDQPLVEKSPLPNGGMTVKKRTVKIKRPKLPVVVETVTVIRPSDDRTHEPV